MFNHMTFLTAWCTVAVAFTLYLIIRKEHRKAWLWFGLPAMAVGLLLVGKTNGQTWGFFALLVTCWGLHRADEPEWLYPHMIIPAALGLVWAALHSGGIVEFFAQATKWIVMGPVVWMAALGAWSLLQGMFGDDRGDARIRGAQLVDPKDVITKVRKQESHAKIGQVPVPVAIEPNSFLFVGAPGSGKSNTFIQMLTSARERGQKAIIVDPSGEFLRRFYREGQDKIMNPFDQRGENWSPFSEMRESYDAENIAQSIIPASGNGKSDEDWNKYSQSLIAAVLRRLWEKGEDSNERLTHYLTIAKAEELEKLVEGLPAQTLFDTGAGKMLASVRGIIGAYLPAYTYLNPLTGVGDGFSVRDWMESDDDSWLFLAYRDDQLAAIKPLLAAWLGFAISALLSLPPERSRRRWFMLDEFARLGRVNQLEELFSNGRKYGGCVVAGMQTISQPRDLYGREKAQNMLACLGSWLVLRSPDDDTARYMSTFLGDEEIRRVSYSGSSKDGNENWSERIEKSAIVLPRQLQDLASNTGYLNLAGDIPTCKINIPLPSDIPAEAPAAYEPRKIYRTGVFTVPVEMPT